jgi:hypothetical protein
MKNENGIANEWHGDGVVFFYEKYEQKFFYSDVNSYLCKPNFTLKS